MSLCHVPPINSICPLLSNIGEQEGNKKKGYGHKHHVHQRSLGQNGENEYCLYIFLSHLKFISFSHDLLYMCSRLSDMDEVLPLPTDISMYLLMLIIPFITHFLLATSGHQVTWQTMSSSLTVLPQLSAPPSCCTQNPPSLIVKPSSSKSNKCTRGVSFNSDGMYCFTFYTYIDYV